MVRWYSAHRPERHGRWVDTEADREWCNNEAARPFSFDPGLSQGRHRPLVRLRVVPRL